jgi:hypothetical protein
MLTTEQIKREMEAFVNRQAPAGIMQAKVVAVNEGEATVEVSLPGGALIPDARLRSVVKDGNRFVMLPAVGSEVLIGKIAGEDEYVVLAVEDVTDIISEVGTTTVSWDETGVLVQNAGDTLKQALTLIVEAVQQVVVMYGNNPNYVKLGQALTKINNILK